MSGSITVEARVVGQRRPIIEGAPLSLPDVEAAPVTLGQLIERAVRAELSAFRERQEARRLVQVLSPEQIEAGAARGKIAPGGREEAPAPAPEDAVATALQAFEDGLYYVFIDHAQQERLDAEVPLKPGSRVTFLRLVALAGG